LFNQSRFYLTNVIYIFLWRKSPVEKSGGILGVMS